MGKVILIIIGLIIATIGVICIFDARVITKKMFGFGDQNEGSTGLKILGFLVSITGAYTLIYKYYNNITNLENYCNSIKSIVIFLERGTKNDKVFRK